MEVLIFIMALLVSFPGKTNRAIKSLTALLIFPGIWQGHYGNNGPAILLIELALLCNYGINAMFLVSREKIMLRHTVAVHRLRRRHPRSRRWPSPGCGWARRWSRCTSPGRTLCKYCASSKLYVNMYSSWESKKPLLQYIASFRTKETRFFQTYQLLCVLRSRSLVNRVITPQS